MFKKDNEDRGELYKSVLLFTNIFWLEDSVHAVQSSSSMAVRAGQKVQGTTNGSD